MELMAEVEATVSKVNLKVGDCAGKGDVIVVLEVMKMEFLVEVSAPAVVMEVFVKEGDLVKEGQLLARLKPT